MRTFGFDDLITRISLHCLEGDSRKAAAKLMDRFAPPDKLTREPFRIKDFQATTLIKSNSFPIECPSEMFQFDLKTWPTEKGLGLSARASGSARGSSCPIEGKSTGSGHDRRR